MQPASVNQVLTTAAALLTLGRFGRLATMVLAVDPQAGLVVLKGGGDTTLSAAPDDTDTWYQGRGPDQRPGRPGAQQWHHGHRGPGGHQLVQRPYDGSGWDPADIEGVISRRWSR